MVANSVFMERSDGLGVQVTGEDSMPSGPGSESVRGRSYGGAVFEAGDEGSAQGYRCLGHPF